MSVNPRLNIDALAFFSYTIRNVTKKDKQF